MEEDSELLLIMKTKAAALDKLKAKVLGMHPYEVPEFIALPVRYIFKIAFLFAKCHFTTGYHQ